MTAPAMVLLADAYDFLEAVAVTGASFLLRSTRKRRPTGRRPLPDGSHLTTICAGRYQAGRGYGRLEVRIIEAWMTIESADGTRVRRRSGRSPHGTRPPPAGG
ncbi:hypothetical protein [Streptomyces sp. NEAU-W12]|uniref:hypothetical protein n=1 Tax=Streptomyces sp. NEAU-W12 TaxID=2994668 RepID=UPI00224ABB13|nr:hypothetical protein [Streptomyces sp. NEAU-W12]MCX2928206.1 hypothetical protein [Streptomyces sp. NEAU-W12]